MWENFVFHAMIAFVSWFFVQFRNVVPNKSKTDSVKAPLILYSIHHIYIFGIFEVLLKYKLISFTQSNIIIESQSFSAQSLDQV